jgi:hypothetical protein
MAKKHTYKSQDVERIDLGAAPFERGSFYLILRSFGFGELGGGSGLGGRWSA